MTLPTNFPQTKVLVFGLNYAPELTGIGKNTGELAVRAPQTPDLLVDADFRMRSRSTKWDR